MRALLAACAASLAIYVSLAVLVLDRKLSLGPLAAELEAGLKRAAALDAPKFVILAGSNGPYSHRCEVMEPILGRPCVNAGLAVGIGLDYLFSRWDGLLAAGDIVYMPMEPAQYARGRLATATGPDAAIMIGHDRATLLRLSPERWLGAVLAYDGRALAMAGVEMALLAVGLPEPRVQTTRNAWGDRFGHDAASAAANAGLIAAIRAAPLDAGAIAAGHGAALIADFTRRMAARGVIVIGGLSTELDDAAPDENAVAAMQAIYTRNGGAFLILPNRSRYPRDAFYDGPEHLNEEAQLRHARAVAQAIAARLGARVSARAGSG